MDEKIKDWPKESWPKELLEVPQPPKKLRIRGGQPNLDFCRLCIVGPRKYSEYAEVVCQNLIAGLSGHPISIVSGLAYGIDSIAHQAALSNRVHCIAVPGSGLADQVIYPRAHLNLAHEILESGGCLISEYPDNFRAINWAFPQRNRIMVGLSKATLIIEAEEKSGTMITARMTTDYNREMLAVPGSILSQNSAGSNSLIKDGAHVIRNSTDLLHILGFEIEKNNPTIAADITPAKIRNLSVNEKIIYENIDSPTKIENLIAKNLMPINTFNEILSLLELKDLIQFVDGKICKK